jgi:hypothetical protein
MNQLTEKDLQQHVPIAAWLLIVTSGLMVLIGAFVFVLLAGIGLASGEGEAFAVLGVVATAVGGLLAALGLPGIAAGYGMLKRKNWGRIVGIIIAALNLFSFPVGTALGAYILFVLLQSSAEQYFANGVRA